MKKFDVLVGGYYGFGNIGDEAMLESLCRSLRDMHPNVRICVLSASPLETARRLGVSSVRRDDPVAVIRAMSESELYISGGGSLLQDTTSRRSLFYYASLMMIGKLICGRLYVFANGIGKIKGVGIARAALRLADRISVRDPASMRRIIDMGIDSKKIRLAADPALLLNSRDISAESSLKACGVGNRRYFAVSLRKLECKFNMSAVEKFARTYRSVPIFISMEDKYDLDLCSAAAARCGGAVLQPRNYSQLLAVLKSADFAIGMRLHFLVAAASVGIPFGALSYDCKTDAFMEYVGNDAVVRADNISTDTLFWVKSKMTAADRERVDELCKCARIDAEMLLSDIFYVDARIPVREKVENMR